MDTESISSTLSALSVESFSNTLDLSRMILLRSYVLQKMVDLRSNYLNILQFLQKKIKPMLEDWTKKIHYNVDEQQVRDFYSNLDSLLAAEMLIDEKLNDSIQKGKINDTDNILQSSTIGSTLYKLKEQLNPYRDFIDGFDKSLKIASHISISNSMSETIEEEGKNVTIDPKRKSKDGLLNALLFYPLHHACEMSVLLKVLSVFTPSTHADIRDIVRAQQLYQSLVSSIKSPYQKYLLEEAHSLCDQFQKDWDEIGCCNKQGFGTKRGGSVKSWKIRWFIFKQYDLRYFEEPLSEKPLATLDLNNCISVFSDETQNKPNCIGLEFRDRTYYIYYTSINEKTEWMNMFAWRLYLLKSVSYRSKKALEPLKGFPTVLNLIS